MLSEAKSRFCGRVMEGWNVEAHGRMSVQNRK